MTIYDPIIWHANIKKYDENYYKLTLYPSKEKQNKIRWETIIPEDFKPNKMTNSISRTRSKIFEYAYCNDFDYFVTLTLNPEKHDRTDLKSFIKKLSRFIRWYRDKYDCNIQYILIPEKHKKYNAYHMHGLIKGIPESHLTVNKHGYLDWYAYADRFGFINLSRVKSKERVAKYITKYITKDLYNQELEKNKKLYYCSRGLKISKDIFTYIGRDFDSYMQPFFSKKMKYDYSSDYCRVKYMSKDEYDIFINSQINKQEKQVFSR